MPSVDKIISGLDPGSDEGSFSGGAATLKCL